MGFGRFAPCSERDVEGPAATRGTAGVIFLSLPLPLTKLRIGRKAAVLRYPLPVRERTGGADFAGWGHPALIEERNPNREDLYTLLV